MKDFKYYYEQAKKETSDPSHHFYDGWAKGEDEYENEKEFLKSVDEAYSGGLDTKNFVIKKSKENPKQSMYVFNFKSKTKEKFVIGVDKINGKLVPDFGQKLSDFEADGNSLS